MKKSKEQKMREFQEQGAFERVFKHGISHTSDDVLSLTPTQKDLLLEALEDFYVSYKGLPDVWIAKRELQEKIKNTKPIEPKV